MSGRSLHHQPDGRLTVGARKTMRRNPRRDPRERLREVARAASPDAYPVRIAFRLPKWADGVISPGPHGVGIQVLAGAFVRIGSGSSDHCFVKAQELCAVVARDRPAFTAEAVIVHTDAPDRTYSRYLSVVLGQLVVSSATLEPKIYEAA